VRSIGRRELEFYVTALQSAAFNAVLDERLEASTLGELRSGDVAVKHDNGALFDVDDATASSEETRARLDRFEISPSGPMWGPEMKRARGDVDRSELRALAELGIESADALTSEDGIILKGARRPLRVPVTQHDVSAGVDENGHYIRFAFDLPRGAFATSVMQEIMKSERVADTGGGARGIAPTTDRPSDEREVN
jgi:tRNA pseudouridine13 synthase